MSLESISLSQLSLMHDGAAAAEPLRERKMPPFDPKLQNFTLLGPDGLTPVTISMSVIDAQRVIMANKGVSMGVQLGLCLMALIALLFLVPLSRLRRPIALIHITLLVVAVMRVGLFIYFFPGPLSEYYNRWTKDRSVLTDENFQPIAASNAFSVIQFSLIETALIMQSWGLMKTWPNGWRIIVRASAVVLAGATIVMKALWISHYTRALHTMNLPVNMDHVGQAAMALGAISIFYFCGIFATDLVAHMIATRGILTRLDDGLSHLEILAIGNGVLMVLPSVFAGLELASGLTGNYVIDFDAGSWVMTLVSAGLPMTSLIARYRGPISGQSSRQASHRSLTTRRKPCRQLSSKTGGSQVEYGTPLHSPASSSYTYSTKATSIGSARSDRNESITDRPDLRHMTLDLELSRQELTFESLFVEKGPASDSNKYLGQL